MTIEQIRNREFEKSKYEIKGKLDKLIKGVADKDGEFVSNFEKLGNIVARYARLSCTDDVESSYQDLIKGAIGVSLIDKYTDTNKSVDIEWFYQQLKKALNTRIIEEVKLMIALTRRVKYDNGWN